MHLACKTLASFLLIFGFSTKGAVPEEKWGALHRDFYLDISDFQGTTVITDIQWKIGNTRIARYTAKEGSARQGFEIFPNGTLRIKNLMRNNSNTYKVFLYDENGKNMFEKMFELKTLEAVSIPEISWNCINKSMTCKVKDGTDPELTLQQNNKVIKKRPQKIITHSWASKSNQLFTCTARNKVSRETSVANIDCSEKVLDLYLILGTCGGGIVLIIFVSLLIFFIKKRKKQNRRTNVEELELCVQRVTAKEKVWRPQQTPGSTPQKPAASQPPAPPSHRCQVSGQRPPPPGPRAQHQQQKRPPPPSGPQVPQQKGPPLPRPRVQQKPPHGAEENS